VCRRHGMRAEEALPHGVERAGANVAVDDADGGEREGEELGSGRAGGRQDASNSADGVS
jgi:hypothetical protein